MGVCVPVGWLPAEQALAVAEIAERYGNGEVRLTVWQNLLIPNIRTRDVEAVCVLLRTAGLDYTAGRIMSGTVACTGSRGCRFAATDTKGHALEIARLLDNTFQIEQPMNLHVTGCNNSCAQHYVGDVGLMGIKVGGKEGYQVNLGGGAGNEQGLARELFPAMPYDEVKPTLQRLFASFNQRRTADESFVEFCRRHTLEELRGMCAVEVQRGRAC